MNTTDKETAERRIKSRLGELAWNELPESSKKKLLETAQGSIMQLDNTVFQEFYKRFR